MKPTTKLSILFFVALIFSSFLGIDEVHAIRTLIEVDIVNDTVWTKAMNPIILRKDPKDGNVIRIANGAQLTIEPGVQIAMGKGMTFHVTNQCQRGYFGDECYRNENEEIKTPKLIAKGTKEEPIIVTSEEDIKGKPVNEGYWQSFIIEGKDNEVEFVNFRYGGAKGFDSTVRVTKKSIFKNNVIENNINDAIFLKDSVFEGNVIRNNTGNGILCDYRCEIKNNVIMNNTKNAIVLSPEYKTIIQNNFIYGNEEYAIKFADINYFPLEIIDNYISMNKGGIFIDKVREDIKIDNNNFFKNKDFAIYSEKVNENVLIPLIKNWYGIDTGASSKEGPFFVPLGFNTSDFLKDAIPFGFPKETMAEIEYTKYLTDRQIDKSFFGIKVTSPAIFGNKSKAGSLLQYELDINNLQTKTIENIKLEINIPSDQELLKCSVSQASKESEYILKSVCDDKIDNSVDVNNQKINWNAGNFSALTGQKLYFVTAIKSSKQGPKNVELPKIIFFQGSNFIRTVDYELDNEAIVQKIEEEKISPIVEDPKKEVIEEKKVEQEYEIKAVPKKSKRDIRALLLEKKREMEEKAKILEPIIPEVKKEEVVEEKKVVNTDTPFEIGKMTARMVRDNLRFVLTTDSGKEFYLFNSSQWEELVKFIRSEDKNKKIRVYGNYYLSVDGEKIGINFTHFEIE